MSAIKLSIIIVAYKNQSVLARCLNSIPKIPSWEVIVIDNSKKNGGFAVGCNLGAAKATGDYLLFLNPDCVMSEKSVKVLIEHFSKYPSTGIVAPKIVNLMQQPQLSYSLQPTFISSIFVYSFLGKYLHFLPLVKNHWFDHKIASHMIQVGAVTGAAFIIRNSLFKKLKGFDEHFFMYWEDTDLCRRCLVDGNTVVYEPSAVIMHEGAASTPKNNQTVLRWFKQSRQYFFRKHFGNVQGLTVEYFLRAAESWRYALLTLLVFGLLIAIIR